MTLKIKNLITLTLFILCTMLVPSVNYASDDKVRRDTTSQDSEIASNIQALGTSAQKGEILNYAQNAARDYATAEIEGWLAGNGNARLKLDVDDQFSLKNSSVEILFPWYEASDHLFFTQHVIHRTNDRTQVNNGLGIRHFGEKWMTGVNVFFDYDLSHNHSRMGIGGELWSDFIKLAANGYFRLSNWRSASELNNDYYARPANGWDIRSEGWLPIYPNIGAGLKLEKYYGREVAFLTKDNRQRNPYAYTTNINWTPFPLLTLNAEHQGGLKGLSDSRFGLQINWVPGLSMAGHFMPEAVGAMRSLAGSRRDLVERNNNIILDYKQRTFIELSLPVRIIGRTGDIRPLVSAIKVNTR